MEAVAAALDDLLKLIKKLANANANNMVVTADHGFLFQQRALEESDFASQEAVGSNITVRNRRFVLGTGLAKGSSFRHFTAAQVGLVGEVEILIPKSINRRRVSGSGSRYVHGGARPAGSRRAAPPHQQEAHQRRAPRRGRYPARRDQRHHRRPVQRHPLPGRGRHREGPGAHPARRPLQPGGQAHLRPAHAHLRHDLRQRPRP